MCVRHGKIIKSLGIQQGRIGCLTSGNKGQARYDTAAEGSRCQCQ